VDTQDYGHLPDEVVSLHTAPRLIVPVLQ